MKIKLPKINILKETKETRRERINNSKSMSTFVSKNKKKENNRRKIKETLKSKY